MLLIAVLLYALGLVLDVVNLVLGIMRHKRGRGPSGCMFLTMVPYLCGSATMPIWWVWKVAISAFLLCWNFLFWAVGPWLYGTFFNGRTSLHRAVILNKVLGLRRCSEGRLDSNARDNRGWTPLHIAASMGRTEATQVLLSSGAEPNARDCDGFTPLHYAALRGNPDLVKALLAAGGDPWSQSGSQATPIDNAHRTGHYEVEELLRSFVKGA